MPEHLGLSVARYRLLEQYRANGYRDDDGKLRAAINRTFKPPVPPLARSELTPHRGQSDA